MKLVDIRLLKVEFYLNKDFKEKSDELTFNPNIALRHEFNKETNDLAVFVRLKQKDGEIPYFFEVESGGLFRFDATPEPELLDTLATINCPAIIFPYLRETIADLTRRAGFTPLHINPINFIELAKARKEKTTTEPASK